MRRDYIDINEVTGNQSSGNAENNDSVMRKRDQPGRVNTFTRNVAAECDVYGFRLDMQETKTFDPVVSVPQPDGSRRRVDARTLPFIRFEDNEAHTQRNHALEPSSAASACGLACYLRAINTI